MNKKNLEVKAIGKEELNTIVGGAAGNNNASKSNESDLANGGPGGDSETIALDSPGQNW